MPKFHYTVKDSSGQTITSEAESYDKNSLIQKLQGQGYFITKIEEASSTPLSKSSPTSEIPHIKFSHKKITLNDLLIFARQLVTMLESGVTLLRSLEVIVEQVESENFHKILKKITADIEQGNSLSEAMAKHPKVFNQLWISLVEVGEAAGTMPQVLTKISFYIEQQAAFKSTVISAVMYPVILAFVCMGAIAFFALFVGPRFETVFKSMDVELPMITKLLLSSFRFIKNNFWFICAGTGAGMFFFRQYSKTRAGEYQIEKFFFSLPTFGNIYKLIIIERFSSQMAILVDSGVPILHALDISQRLVDNITCSDVIHKIKESVRQGELLVSPMISTKFFPPLAIQMISVGEETGELSKMLKHVAHYYQTSVETFMKRLGTVIEPFMLVFMGTIIGVIVLAMFLPMFNIASLGGG